MYHFKKIAFLFTIIYLSSSSSKAFDGILDSLASTGKWAMKGCTQENAANLSEKARRNCFSPAAIEANPKFINTFRNKHCRNPRTPYRRECQAIKNALGGGRNNMYTRGGNNYKDNRYGCDNYGRNTLRGGRNNMYARGGNNYGRNSGAYNNSYDDYNNGNYDNYDDQGYYDNEEYYDDQGYYDNEEYYDDQGYYGDY